MVTNESKKWPPLSTAVKEVQKAMKLLEKEFKENLTARKQLLKDVRAGTITKAQSDELDGKLHDRSNEILTAMFKLAMKMGDLK